MRWLVILLVFCTPLAIAEESTHQAAFVEGRYIEAAQVFEAAPTSDNLAFAARSYLAEAMTAPDHIPPPALLDQAETLAREALLQSPDHIEARLQLAIALSLKARPMTTRAAMRSGYGEQSKDLVDAVLLDDPDNAYAHAFLSVWHLEVRRRGGAIGASMLGASVKKARRHYQRAVLFDPDDASVHWQFARALTALNAKKYRAEIDEALTEASNCNVDSALERTMQSRAQTLEAALNTQRRAATERLAEKML